MIMRAEALERRLVELFLIFRMSDGDDEACALLQRATVEIHCAVFCDEPMDVVTCGDSARAQIQSRHYLVDAFLCC